MFAEMSIGGAVLTVADLVADPPLRLAVRRRARRAGPALEAAAVSELAEPGPWLQGGELLLTIGLLLDESDAGCAAYVAELDAPRACARSALGLGADLRYQSAPAAPGRRRPRTAGLPLLTVPGRGAVHRGHQGGLRAAGAGGTPAAGVGAAHPARAHRGGGAARRARRHPRRAPSGPPAGPPSWSTCWNARSPAPAPATSSVAEFAGMVGGGARAGPARRRRRCHAPGGGARCTRSGSRRLRAWLLLDGPADRAELQPGHRRPRLAALAGARTRARAGRRAAAGPRAGAGPAGPRHGRRPRRRPLARPPSGCPTATCAPPSSPPRDAEDLAADLAACAARCAGRAWSRSARSTRSSSPCRSASTWPPCCAPSRAGASRRHRGRGRGPVRWPCRCGRPARRCRRAGSPGGTCTPPTSRAADCCCAIDAGDRLQAYADAVLGPLDAAPRPADLVRALDDVPGAQRPLGGGRGGAARAPAHRAEPDRAVEELTGRRLGSAHDRQELWLALRARDLARMSDG